ncbi:hypothetical protein LPB140_10455 [Sphingorhabdus lutea]|uniref:Uncharacterized protein n=1 Tax=Sphingorhabdus lutea TaxID=1913578 RepID=A0A1L3JDD1_9SPHN|nr:hypothetical protein [Sphingorhabdus lutea]APG63138.1 hypothetical protein LPB140_10455 [Sphingorhabdus lutea]
MNYENYYQDKELISRHKRRPEIMFALAEAVKECRDLDGLSNRELYQDAYPFSLECKQDFPLRLKAGKDFINSQITYTKDNRITKSVPVFLAWLWYRHEERAKALYDEFGFDHHPYQGEPDLNDCPMHVVNSFQPRTQPSGADSDSLSEETTDQKEQMPSLVTGVPDQTADTGTTTEKSVFWRIFASSEFMASFAISGALVVAAYWIGMIPV